MLDTFSITYRHRDGSISRQTQTGDDLLSVIAQHGPVGATVVTVAMQCRAYSRTGAIAGAGGPRCSRFSSAGEYCHQHAPKVARNALTPFHRGEV